MEETDSEKVDFAMVGELVFGEFEYGEEECVMGENAC